MISLNLNSINKANNKIPFSQQQSEPQKILARSVSQDETLRQQADESAKEGYFDKAINLYKQALMVNSQNEDATLSLAKTYKLNSDFKNAIPYFQKACGQKPEDLELKTLLGECYKQNGQYIPAKQLFQEVLRINPYYDYANRNLLDTENLQKAVFSPSQAYRERQEAASKNLNTAISMASKFLPKGYMKNMADLTVTFDKTASMGGRSNIAQYEHNKRKVSVMDDYTYASPVIVASYLTHEFVHGYDNDPYTSICEEQDAYRKQAEFWVKNSLKVEDPEMDYVGDLYRQSPKTLDNRVAEIYQLRDKTIPETSYNHPPTNKKIAASQKLDMNAAPLKAYDIIV